MLFRVLATRVKEQLKELPERLKDILEQKK